MDADGSHEQRLTYFNDPDHEEYPGGQVIVADSSWSPDGRRLGATVLTARRRENARIVLIELDGNPSAGD
jgi:hypothetical protein